MRIFGKIKKVDSEKRIITVETKYRLYLIYFKRSLMNKYKYFLFKNNLIDLEIVDPEVHFGYRVFNVHYITTIKSLTNGVTYFDRKSLVESLGTILTSSKYYMYLDLEKTMPPYNYKGNFNSEIIQLAFLLEDKDGNEVARYNNYVKPVINPYLNLRTSKFLNLDTKEFNQKSILPAKVYKDFKHFLKKYHPAIIVYGKNDILSLKDFYRFNRFESLMPISRIINISSLIVEHYHHDKELGLFNLYEMFYHKHFIQKHDAYDDAVITSFVYKAFVKDVLNQK